ncbi:EKC/KEOPS complex [Salix suchowensis]|nr:EKC/KEOPS complex [Salix suchowensis]
MYCTFHWLFLEFSLVCKLANGDGGWELGSSVRYKLGLVFKESLKRYEISDSTTCILAARFNASPDEMKPVEKLSGKEIKLEGLEGRANQSQMQKHSGLEVGISSIADAITCRIAACDAL